MPYANITEEELDAVCTRMQELRIEIFEINEMIGRMFENRYITADMIAEALNEKEDPDDLLSLRLIYNSWEGDHQHINYAIKQFSTILKKIRSYQ